MRRELVSQIARMCAIRRSGDSCFDKKFLIMGKHPHNIAGIVDVIRIGRID